MLEKDTEGSQITESKHKEAPLEDDINCQLSKKTKRKQLTRYCRDIRVKIGVLTPVRDVCVLDSPAWCII